VTPGVVHTISGYIQFPTFALNMNGSTYLAWYRANGTNISYDQAPFSSDLDNVTRFIRTGTAPVDAATVSLILDGANMATNPADVTAILVEAASGEDVYADGNTAGWAWDGTAGLSPSSELASPDQEVTPSSIASGALIGQPDLTAGLVSISPASVASSSALGQPALAAGAVTLLPVSIAPTVAVGAPTVGARRQLVSTTIIGFTATVHRYTTDRFGDRVEASTHTLDRCAFAPRGNAGLLSTRENTDRANTVTSAAALYTQAGADIVATDVIELPDGARWEVSGAPERWQSPFPGAHTFGVIVPLERITG
jgi:hypothetical protein